MCVLCVSPRPESGKGACPSCSRIFVQVGVVIALKLSKESIVGAVPAYLVRHGMRTSKMMPDVIECGVLQNAMRL